MGVGTTNFKKKLVISDKEKREVMAGSEKIKKLSAPLKKQMAIDEHDLMIANMWKDQKYKWLTFGKPPAIRTPDEMRERIREYFEWCRIRRKPKTVPGLASALDMSTDAIRNYEKHAPFADIIKRLKVQLESELEEDLISAKTTPIGRIFALKNRFGWVDKREITHDFEGAGAFMKMLSSKAIDDTMHDVIDGEIAPEDPSGLLAQG